jgi:hypothetical protein
LYLTTTTICFDQTVSSLSFAYSTPAVFTVQSLQVHSARRLRKLQPQE